MGHRNHISQLLEYIQSFQVVQCQMHHEKVAVDENNQPIFHSENNRIIFNRVNLCNSKLRNVRLGCAHSHSNLNFQNALEELSKAMPKHAKLISEEKKQFISVIAKLYDLDHKVGHLEHDIAMANTENNFGKILEIKTHLQNLKLEHRKLMDQLQNIKAKIENCIAIAFTNAYK